MKNPAARDDFRFVLCEYLLARLAHGNRKIVIIAADARYRHRDTLFRDRAPVLGLRKIGKNVAACKPVLIQIAREQRRLVYHEAAQLRENLPFHSHLSLIAVRRILPLICLLFVFVSQRR